jgi:FkbM family methyltransferase
MLYHNGKNKARIGGILHPARLAVFFCLVGMFLYAYADSGKYSNIVVVLTHWPRYSKMITTYILHLYSFRIIKDNGQENCLTWVPTNNTLLFFFFFFFFFLSAILTRTHLFSPIYYCTGLGGRKMLQEVLDPAALLAGLGISMTTKMGGLQITEYCKRDNAAQLAYKFKNQTVDVPFYTACGSNEWVDVLHKLSPNGPKTFVDIGCNKGYTSAKFFALWAPELGFAPATLRKKRPEVLCGTCGDCNEQAHSSVKESSGPVTVFCMEPSLYNYANLIMTRDKFFSNNKQQVQWYTVNAAMSNDTGLIQFPRDCVDELCSLDGSSDGAKPNNFDYVSLMTVDYFMKKYQVPYIDVLKIDTEGFDATVIAGAMEGLSSGRIGIISFEYHEVGVWREYSLESIVEKLDGLDYVCYYDGKGGELSRLTGCWHEAYEAYAWSNVVCVPRKHAIYPEMEKMTTRYMEMKDSYYQLDEEQAGM